MNVLIVTFGSRGDVQPYVALGKGLKADGHTVAICTSVSFESFIIDQGLGYGYMNDGLMNLVDSDAGRDAMENTTNILAWVRTARRLAREVAPMQRQMLRDSWMTAQEVDPDLIVFHPKAFGGPHIAEKLGVPAIMAVPLPAFVPTAESPSILFPQWRLGGWYNHLTYTLTARLTQSQVGKYVKEWRREQGMPSSARNRDFLHMTNGEPIPVLHCYSKHVSPEPSDWPDTACVTGYWFLERSDEWQPSHDLQTFLDSGEMPVYVGFGSMAGRDPQRITAVVIDALQQAGVRGVIATGWGGLAAEEYPDTILKIDSAPHDWLFPRMAAVVHHGGAGTTAAGLQAGKPTIICPFFGDQPFWGKRVEKLGAGPRPIAQKKLTAENLASAINQAMQDSGIRQRVKQLGEQLQAEDGVGCAVELIDEYGTVLNSRRHDKGQSSVHSEQAKSTTL